MLRTPSCAVAVRARISEETPRDLRGVDLLADRLPARLGVTIEPIEGRRGPFGRTPFADDLTASRETLRRAGSAVAARLAAGEQSLTLASDCALALGTLPALAAVRPDACVLWLDAHCDFDTPETSTLGFLGCMSLAGATGAWDAGLGAPLPPERVVLCGVRGSLDEFDGAGRAAVEDSAVRLVSPGPEAQRGVLAEIGGAAVYVHLDPDVLGPADNPVPYARPGGLSLGLLEELLRAVRARGPIVGVELTAFHSDDDARKREALADRLIDCLALLACAESHNACS
jgi:arginase family enzyme